MFYWRTELPGRDAGTSVVQKEPAGASAPLLHCRHCCAAGWHLAGAAPHQTDCRTALCMPFQREEDSVRAFPCCPLADSQQNSLRAEPARCLTPATSHF